MNLWARLPDGTDVPQLVRDCENAGVVLAAGSEWFPAEATGPFVRLNCAGPHPAAFPDGARIFGETLGRHHGRERTAEPSPHPPPGGSSVEEARPAAGTTAGPSPAV